MSQIKGKCVVIFTIFNIFQVGTVYGSGNEAVVKPVEEKLILEGNELKLPCSLPNFNEHNESVTWLFQGLPWFLLPAIDFDDVKVNVGWENTDYTLRIVNVTTTFTGTFICHRQIGNEILRSYVYVMVRERKENSICDTIFHKHGTPYQALESQEAHLLCGLDCKHNSMVTWTKENYNSDIAEDEMVSIIKLKQLNALVLKSVRSHHYGIYYCSFGNASFKLRLQAKWGSVAANITELPGISSWNITTIFSTPTSTVASSTPNAVANSTREQKEKTLPKNFDVDKYKNKILETWQPSFYWILPICTILLFIVIFFLIICDHAPDNILA